ncbi:MAG: rhodanese-like domain-containing protein [Anaerolineales bacterium]|nr:rhodanese-like domain-containing protein [Anaerolineales bacterium]
MKPKRSIRSSVHERHQNRLHLWAALGAIFVLALIAFVLLAFSTEPETASPVIPGGEITVEQAYEKYQQGAFFLDVRQPEEWNQYHVPNTTLIPLGELPNRLNELPRDREIIVICRSGNRSQTGRDILLQAGFPRVVSMSGGIRQWSAMGYPIEGTRP